MSSSKKKNAALPKGHGYDKSKGAIVHYKKIGVIYNPMSGKGLGKKIFTKQIEPLLKQHLSDRELKIMPTTKAGGAKDNAEQLIKDGCDLIVACGGDGTIHETLNGIMDINTNRAGAAMAIIPMGTGNDFAKSVKLSEKVSNKWHLKYERIVNLIQRGYTIQADIGLLESTHFVDHQKVELHQKYFMNETSIGISADIMKTVNSQSSFWFSKDVTFQFQSFAKQFTYVNKNVEYDIDKGSNKGELKSQLIAISNGQFFGSGMQVNPSANVDDGLLTVCMFGDCGVSDMLSVVPAMYKGEHYKRPKVHFEHCKEIKLSLKNPNDIVYIECDGELFGQLPCTANCIVGALPIIVDETPQHSHPNHPNSSL